MKYNSLYIHEIVTSVSETHAFDKDRLFAVNTSNVEKGVILSPPLVNVDELKGQFKKTIQKDDILFSEIRPANQHYALVSIQDTRDYVVSTKLMVLRLINKSVDLLYFYYWLTNNNFLAILQSRAENRICSFPQITFDLLSEYLVPIPELEIQKKISVFIKTIDDKISNNNAINAELEALAKTIYDYWFLQFEFPNEEGLPYKSSGGKMVWSEELKREIPEGWGVKNIRAVCDIVDCLHSKKPDYSFEDENYYLLQLENLTSSGYIDLSEKYFITKEDYLNWTSKIEIQENDFVITNAGRTGAVGMIPAGVKCALGRNFTAIRPKMINPYYLRMFLQSPYMEIQIKSNLDSGAFFKSFNVKSIKEILVLVPDTHTLTRASEIFTFLVKKIEQQIAENQELAALRDWLLPMLMNGQVGFKDTK